MHSGWMKHLEEEILEILRHSPVEEDYPHALNVREWVLRLRPEAGDALLLAALAHDIERAVPDIKVQRSRFNDYDEFKRRHAENSARFMARLMQKYPVPEPLRQRVLFLIRHHEFGADGDEEAKLLQDADSLSFFETNLPAYLKREGKEETFRRMQWGYRRLSPRGRKCLKAMHFKDPEIQSMVDRLFEEAG